MEFRFKKIESGCFDGVISACVVDKSGQWLRFNVDLETEMTIPLSVKVSPFESSIFYKLFVTALGIKKIYSEDMLNGERLNFNIQVNNQSDGMKWYLKDVLPPQHTVD